MSEKCPKCGANVNDILPCYRGTETIHHYEVVRFECGTTTKGGEVGMEGTNCLFRQVENLTNANHTLRAVLGAAHSYVSSCIARGVFIDDQKISHILRVESGVVRCRKET